MVKKVKSKKYLEAASKIKQNETYGAKNAFDLIPELATAKFNESVDISFRLGVDPRHADQMIRGSISLPNGLGKEVRLLVLTSGTNISIAEKAGADAALSVAPYYNKPTQEGIYQHYKAINDATGLPIFIYNIPGRSVINVTDETLARLSELPNIAGVKDATGDLTRPYMLRAAGGESLTQFTGEDLTAVAFNAAGGHGCISVVSNLMPKRTAEIQEACMRGDFAQAATMQEELVMLCDVLFSETSPSPAKYALSLMGKCSVELRLPLVQPSDKVKENITKAIKQLSLI